MAYSCTKKREYWTKDPSYNEDAHDDMVVLVHKYSSYRRTQRQLKVLSQTISDCSDPLEMKNLVLEHQLQQVLLWAQAANVTKSMNGSKCDPLQPHMKLELLIHALSLRKLIGKSNLKVLELQKIGASGLATMMGMEPRKLSKRKEQAKARIKGKHKFTNLARWAGGNNENESFRNLFADQELADLCGMTEVKFVSKTKDTIRDVLETLSFASRIQEIKSTSSKRKNKTKLKGAISGESPLNQRLGKKNEPWRKGYKAESESSSDSSVECVEKNRKCRKKKRTPTWVRYAEHT